MENQEEEKLEFLKREEIKTMSKDIARLREKEAEKEKERMGRLKIEDKTVEAIKIWKTKEEKPEKPEETLEELGKEKKVEEIREIIQKRIVHLPAPPSKLKKVFARIPFIIILIFILVSVFLFWYSYLRIEKPESPFIPASEEVSQPETPEPEIIQPKKPEASSSLISVENTIILQISNPEEVSDLLSQILQGDFTQNQFTRVLIENTEENKFLGLKEFFEALNVKTPDGLFNRLANDFTLFIYSSQQRNELGLITKVNAFITKVDAEKDFADLLISWESTMEKDTENLFALSGKKGSALASRFRTSFYEKVGFRFLTISEADFGICYAWFGDYFVLTASFESMKRVIDETEAKKAEEKIGQLFMIGFDGKILTPQLEEVFKKYRPGGVLLLAKNIESEEQLKKLTQDLQTLSLKETGFPLFISVDQEGDPISRIKFLEEKTSQSQIENTEQAYQIGLNRGKELKELGININLAPLLDIAEPEDFIFERTFQKDIIGISELAKNLTLGQKEAGILTSIKHFPGYKWISFNPEKELAIIEKVPEISQFQKVMEAKPELVMTTNVVYSEIDPAFPFSFSPYGIQFLKDNLGTEILIISDDLSQNYLLENFTLKEIVTKPIQAGIDILIFSGWEIEITKGLDAFFQAFKNGELSQEKIDAAVSRIIKLKEDL